MIELTRRRVLGGVVTGATVLLAGTLPDAIERTQLQARVDVLRAGVYLPGGDTDEAPTVNALTVRVRNERPASGEPITPVPSIWGVDRETQVAWDAARGNYPEIAPGKALTLQLSPPRPSPAVHLKLEEKAVVRLYDKGTERRTDEIFTPADVYPGYSGGDQ